MSLSVFELYLVLCNSSSLILKATLITYRGAKGNLDFFEMNIFPYINAKKTCIHVVLPFI